jgi:hypothetical protein
MLRYASTLVCLLIAVPAGAAAPDVFRSAPGPSVEEVRWQHLASQPSPAAISDFLHQFPDSPHRDEAQKILRGLSMLEPAKPPPAPAQPAVSTARTAVAAKPAAQPLAGTAPSSLSPRCASISERSQMGEGLSNADRTFLAGNCR